MARLAKIPILDPATPEEARNMAGLAMELSEEFRIPFILRPAIRVCHARQDLAWDKLDEQSQRKPPLKRIRADGPQRPVFDSYSTEN